MPFFKNPARSFRRRYKTQAVASLSSTSRTMRSEIDRLVGTLSDPVARKDFEAEMRSFEQMFNRYQADKAHGATLDWDKITPPSAEQIVTYDNLTRVANAGTLNKLAILKLNGGLGTSMGMKGAKSALEVKNGLTFLDLIVEQVQHLNTTERIDVPLLLMTSFNTQSDTVRVIKKAFRDTLLPCPKSAEDDSRTWYPPGHGDLYNALLHSGVLAQLLREGREYLFVSNSDNLGAAVDRKILQHMIESGSEFLMEVTNKTKNDLEGGTLVNYEGSLRLLEKGQVPLEHREDFKSVRNFKSFDTNNLWIDLKAVKRITENGGMELDIIEKLRYMDNGKTVIQLETVAGSAIKAFRNAHGVSVSRQRFLPVKNCADFLLVKSDLYKIQHGCLVFSDLRVFATTPVIKLSDDFRTIDQFRDRFKTIPSTGELDHLTVTGDVYFGRDVTLRGTVIVVATEGQRIHIPDGSVLENRLLAGNLRMIEL